jgi:tetratricopeptide (TPR) repeat protein
LIKGNSDAMFYLGFYYGNQQNNDLMIKYYLMAIELGNYRAMNNLGYYYGEKKDYKLMIIYYLMAIQLGNSNSMYNLGNYYQYGKKDYNAMTQYYLMGIEHGDSNCMYHLGFYYETINDYDAMMKYYIMGAYAGNTSCTNRINKYLSSNPDIRLMELAYDFLTGVNKRTLNKMVTAVMNITNHNILADTMCIICMALAKCVFLECGHPICNKCFIVSNNSCSLCGFKV